MPSADNRTDGALVRVIVPVPGSDEATRRARTQRQAMEFVKTIFPVLSNHLPS